ncbi:hypothetical protein ACHAQJ_009505 [Trichoderma viride]
MKTAAFALLAAASVEQVAATYSLGSSWTQAKAYSCPGNTNNQCNPQQQSGWDFSDVPTGNIGHYGGFDFSGWSCENDFSKRDSLLGARTFGSTGRSIVGDCTADKNTSPCISAAAGTGHFSVDTFSVSTEFDTRLEFHYGMPDGSTCKQSSQCSSQGTTIKNSQCGGAKSVTIVYPGSGKSSCKTKVHHISWDCGSNAPPPSHSQPAHSQPVYTPPPSGGSQHHSKPAHSQPVYTPPSGGSHHHSHSQPGYSLPPYGQTTTGSAGAETTTAPAGAETTTAPYGNTPPAGGETTTAPAGAETTTAPAGAETTTAPAGGETTTPYGNTPPAGTTTAAGETTASTDVAVSTSIISAPGGETTAAAGTTTAVVETTPAGETTAAVTEATTAPAGETTAAAGTTTAVVETTPAGTTAAVTEATTAPAVTSEAGAVTTGSQSVYTTVYQSTSTVFTTSVHTITSCAPEITNCPARTDKPVLTTVTIAVSTTICPVTATITGGSAPQQTSEAGAATQAPPSGTDSGSSPAQTGLPCPDVLPKCINTWLPLVPNCKDNTDASCYCPSKDLVTKVFDCIYSNGQNDDDVSAAIVFFQGVCAGYAGSNPAVATGAATITSIITVTGTPVAAPTDYTTVVVATTVTEPCVSEGSTISGSSTTVYISTAITVPQVSITAAPVTAQPTGVPPAASAPAATAPFESAPVETAPVESAPVQSAPVQSAPGAAPTLVAPPAGAPPASTGTGTGISIPPVNTGIPVVGGAGRLGAGMSLGLAIMAAVVAL